jgi:hypothetical protein
MDIYLLTGLGVLALGVAGLVTYIARPAKGASSGIVRGMYSMLNYRPLVKPFDKRARQIYDEDQGDIEH